MSAMETVTRGATLRERVKAWRKDGKRIALVSASGMLHKGHMGVIAEAQERADRVIVSTIPHPSQPEIPTLEADRDLLQKIGADILFVPPVHEIHPFGPGSSAILDVPSLSGTLEGAARPGYLAAVATLQDKLFNLAGPDVAVYGERDYQRFLVIKRMVEDLFIPVEVIACATLRESDGLAFATANRQLTKPERALAPRLFATLSQYAKRIDQGAREFAALERDGFANLTALGLQPEYFAIRQAADLAPVQPGARDLVVLGAVRFAAVRLIDAVRLRLIERH
jgi:pantoate--beta-alanine ligase